MYVAYIFSRQKKSNPIIIIRSIHISLGIGGMIYQSVPLINKTSIRKQAATGRGMSSQFVGTYLKASKMHIACKYGLFCTVLLVLGQAKVPVADATPMYVQVRHGLPNDKDQPTPQVAPFLAQRRHNQDRGKSTISHIEAKGELKSLRLRLLDKDQVAIDLTSSSTGHEVDFRAPSCPQDAVCIDLSVLNEEPVSARSNIPKLSGPVIEYPEILEPHSNYLDTQSSQIYTGDVVDVAADQNENAIENRPPVHSFADATQMNEKLRRRTTDDVRKCVLKNDHERSVRMYNEAMDANALSTKKVKHALSADGLLGLIAMFSDNPLQGKLAQLSITTLVRLM